jgi:glutamate-1-semialdehyde 2,1-aminomutase
MDTVVVLPPEIEAIAHAVAARGDIGAIIVEPAGAGSGTVPIARGFLQQIQAFARQHEIVFIMDEVVTGFRWSPGGLQEVDGLAPDLTTLAKILAGGFPGGAVTGRRAIMERLEFPPPGTKAAKIGHPGTFNANPLSSAAGVACLREIADGRHQQRARDVAAQIRAGMNSVLCRKGIPGAVYGQSSEFRIVLAGTKVPEACDYDPHDLPLQLLMEGMPEQRLRLMQLAMANHGVHLFGNGGLASSVHRDEDIAETISAWEASIDALDAEGELVG